VFKAQLDEIQKDISLLNDNKKKVEKFSLDQKSEVWKIQIDQSKIPQIQQTRDMIAIAKKRAQSNVEESKKLKKASITQTNVIHTIIDQINALKLKKMKLEAGPQDYPQDVKEHPSMSSLKTIRTNISRLSKHKQKMFNSREKDLRSRIINMRSMIDASESLRESSLDKIKKLNPQYSQASMILRKRFKNMSKKSRLPYPQMHLDVESKLKHNQSFHERLSRGRNINRNNLSKKQL